MPAKMLSSIDPAVEREHIDVVNLQQVKLVWTF